MTVTSVSTDSHMYVPAVGALGTLGLKIGIPSATESLVALPRRQVHEGWFKHREMHVVPLYQL